MATTEPQKWAALGAPRRERIPATTPSGSGDLQRAVSRRFTQLPLDQGIAARRF